MERRRSDPPGGPGLLLVAVFCQVSLATYLLIRGVDFVRAGDGFHGVVALALIAFLMDSFECTIRRLADLRMDRIGGAR